MKWIYLFIAGTLEITWAITMKMSNGFTVLIPSIITGVGYIASAVFLSIALRQLPDEYRFIRVFFYIDSIHNLHPPSQL